MDEFIRIDDDGYAVNTPAISGTHPTDIRPLVAGFGPRRQPEVRITDDDRNLVASVQKATEEALFALVPGALRTIPSRNPDLLT